MEVFSPRSIGARLAFLGCALVCWTCAAPGNVARTQTVEAFPTSGADTDAISIVSVDTRDSAPAVSTLPVPPVAEEGLLGLRVPVFDPSGAALQHFRLALERAASGEGQARIVVDGDSHVASDFFTGFLREHLQARFGDAGHGFVMPVHPWRSYRHRGVSVDSDGHRWETLRIRVNQHAMDHYGLGGVAVESSRAGAFGAVTIASDGDDDRNASLYDLYYLKQPGGGEVDVFIDGRREERISTASDTRIAGYATFERPDGPHRFELRLRGNGPVRIFGLAVERPNSGVIVDALGLNGARMQSQLDWNDALYREHLRRRRPDLVVLWYGTNEAGDDDQPIEIYESQVRRVVQRVRETVPEASCLLMGPSDRPIVDRDAQVFLDRPRTAAVADVQRRVAVELGCGFFDVVQFQGGALATVEWAHFDPPYASPDYVHFTRAGYERVGDVVLSALLQGYSGAALPSAQVGAPHADLGTNRSSESF